ncbi:bifunctional riboflavin kinase/FAD synthetase [Microbispora bryophytorum]|uniref:Riboflavin biosynthesis protein n=1 Tax=Microbispora bryophytorum TaxID=1460882 RepID=A0A8H9LJV4_9ACTN|nr:bifunctional riboflavin kinase/FAD synthetase [Microbispora bryophytorum]MBD3140524.1 bifunctional riboflavin kinase/FAD synthetase [Microbispora bryophytorum]TQS01797.1 bifunctional riboflavin kinase/FAD synthetase [Microbispora bryophytorum]GGO30026.1 riboflavin biosynthesis protein [Microbispora bryophytorum]
MQSWHGLDEVPLDWGRSVVTIGVFDGVHLGHQRMVARAVEMARDLGLPAVAVTFDPHPDEVVRPGSHPPRLTTTDRRAELLFALGVDAVCVLPFTLEFSRMSPDEFVQTALVDRLHAAGVVVGENFRFGHKASGDLETLRTLGEKYDFQAEGVPLVSDGDAISSTVIRERLSVGDVTGAAVLLGRPHRVEGVVVRGHQRGRALGFPTANVESPHHTAIPAEGVYAGWLQCTQSPSPYEGERWPAAISIGTNPTFDGVERTVEAYALDRDDLDLYGAHVAVDFGERLRDTLRFDSIEALIEQMHDDVARARELTS